MAGLWEPGNFLGHLERVHKNSPQSRIARSPRQAPKTWTGRWREPPYAKLKLLRDSLAQRGSSPFRPVRVGAQKAGAWKPPRLEALGWDYVGRTCRAAVGAHERVVLSKAHSHKATKKNFPEPTAAPALNPLPRHSQIGPCSRKNLRGSLHHGRASMAS